MNCTETYKEHIMYTFHGFCKVVIRNAAITAWHGQQRRHKRGISLEYLTEEKFYPLGATDEYFTAPYEEYPVTICGQTIILTNRKLAAALLSLPDRTGKSFSFTFLGITDSGKSGKCTDAAGDNQVSNSQDVEAPAERNGGAFLPPIEKRKLL